MSAIASPEFVSLCHAQLRLLTQQMAESTAALYMADITETTTGQTSHFVPIVSYPESVESWTKNFSAAPWESTARAPLALPGTVESSNVQARPTDQRPEQRPEQKNQQKTKQRPRKVPEQQIVVPLVYTDVVVGLLVAIRRDRPWQSGERTYVETMADSLAAGCVLERRNQWLQGRVAHRRGLQSRQSEVFHNLLHQFRNPLTAVNTFGKLLVKRLEPNDPNKTMATGIVRETSRLRELVTHFDETVALGDADLTAAAPAPLLLPGQPLLPQSSEDRAEASAARKPGAALLQTETDGSEEMDLSNSLGHALTLSPQSLAQVVDPILEVASIVADEKGVRLHTQVSRNTPWVWGEEEALSEVVSNLVDNAVKYSPPGAQVWVQTGVSRIEGDAQYQGVIVADTGPGIPPADLEHLFKRYYRGVQAQGELPGTGLGLAIAQSLVKEMQGAIEVISPAVGTPWLPREPLKPGSQTSAAAAEICGPGTVFIVWLLEAD